ncbi:hypothetical protein RQP53_16495 [Paucibacter sp. APW11]|uniref:Cardiolipin synthase N-terminal domain-containing protein n=1 Tax=Roseateles aquae TaxID=3077235 RepID=A0ABU3PFE0_9BURK|nr:hypothetical protein [Paucibacter sp. APW11]MDT9000877.1 hypothetical protein [Paucibacter sp. APW11]
MPILAFLHIAVAIFFAVHAVRTGRNTVWLFVLLAFPLLGSLVYLFAEYLPEQRNGRVARKAGAALTKVLDPRRELRLAEQALEQTPSMGNRLKLAQALLAADRAAEALPHFEACAQGVFASDPEALAGLARALAAVERVPEACATLDKLFAAQPQRQSGELALLHAELLAHAFPADPGRAEAAFQIALRSHGGIATHSAWGQFLLAQGRAAEAEPILEQVLKDARLSHAHAREQNRRAIDGAEAALQRIAEQRR